VSELPKNFIDEFLDLKRRVSTLERATRVPQVTSAEGAGPQSSMLPAGTYNSLSGVTHQQTTFGNALTVTVKTTASGRLFLVYGCNLTGGGSAGQLASAVPYVYDADTNEQLKPDPDTGIGWVTLANDRNGVVNAAGGGMFEDIGGPRNLRVVMNFIHAGGTSYTSVFGPAWIYAAPL
jgi:hypothetical protein